MNQVTRLKLMEDCLDKTIIKEVHLAEPITEELMRLMGEGGKLQYFPNFPKPYFRIDYPDRYVIQGSVGNLHFRVTFPPSAPPNTETALVALITTGGQAKE